LDTEHKEGLSSWDNFVDKVLERGSFAPIDDKTFTVFGNTETTLEIFK
jgi:hypothetical protein